MPPEKVRVDMGLPALKRRDASRTFGPKQIKLTDEETLWRHIFYVWRQPKIELIRELIRKIILVRPFPFTQK